MFDIEKLQADPQREAVLIVTCVGKPKGQEPTITLLLSDAVRREERMINAKYNRFVFSGPTSEGSIKSDKLKYCEEMVDLCVKDSTGLFASQGKPVPHKNEYLKILLRRYPNMLDWFADALTVALSDDAEFRKAFEEQAEKNS
jgi:hypothetical protein